MLVFLKFAFLPVRRGSPQARAPETLILGEPIKDTAWHDFETRAMV